jgi:tRNA dimethylallyltransferase
MPPIPLIAGPTAVGKTELAVEIALTLKAEIVSADSRQIYRRIIIGTAKPPKETLERVRHHFVGELDLDASLSAGKYADMAETRLSEIISRSAIPLVTGGSTLYLHALINGLDDTPPADRAIRAELNQRLESEGPSSLFDELSRVDPVFASTLDVTKSQRVVRGLEVYLSTGRPLSSYFGSGSPPKHRYNVVILDRDRTHLYERINARVDEMVASGLIEEVVALRDDGYDESHPALRTIGYREVFAHLRGEISRDVMISLIQRNTRRYAKRQLTWFRRFEGARWINLDESFDLESLISDLKSG